MIKMRDLLKESQFQKAINYFKKQISPLKYFRIEQIPAILDVATKHGYKLDQDLIEAFKEVVGEEIWNGIEPEWTSMEAYEWWDNMNVDYFSRTAQSSLQSGLPDLEYASGKKFRGKLIDKSGL